MGLFGRKSKRDTPEVGVEEVDTLEEADAPEEVDEEEAARERALRETLALNEKRLEHGPFDSSEVDEPGDRIDLGGLLLPTAQMELRLEVDEATQSVRAVTLVLGDSAVQLQVFAAPRTEGIWWEIRPGLSAEIQRQGGTAELREGPFGPEVLARMPVRTPDGRTGHQVTRFFGVDGPRWFLRGVFSGAAGVDPQASAALVEIVREVVVVRGPEAMAPRDPIPLRLPEGARRADQPQQEPGGDGRPTADGFRPFERGPEIQEVR